MKATRRCQFDGKDDDALVMSVKQAVATGDIPTAHSDATEYQRVDEKSEPQQQPSPPSTPAPDRDDAEVAEAGPDATGSLGDEKSLASKVSSTTSQEPLHWFGILVPRELRSAQTSFSTATHGLVVQAVNAARGMRDVEAEIRRVRKAVKKAEKAAGS